MANAIVFLLENVEAENIYSKNISHINIGTGKELSINELAKLIAEIIGFTGKILNDESKPDGTPRKLMDVSRMSELGWKYKTELQEGIEKTYNWFKQNQQKVLK